MTNHRSTRSKHVSRLSEGGFSRGFWVFAAFILFVLLTGGGSRHDISSLVFLRPVSFLMALYALWGITKEEVGSVSKPLIFLAILAGVIALQLIPMPPQLWSSLPGRQTALDAYASIGMTPPWLPLALSPSRALNSLMSLSVPFATLLLYARLMPEERRSTIYLVFLAAALSAGFAVLQLLGPDHGPFHLYRVTNDGLPVGLFANRNHQGLLLALGMLSACWIIADSFHHSSRGIIQRTLAAGSLFVFLPLLLLTGSRAGLLLGVASLIPGAAIVYVSLAGAAQRGRTSLSEGKVRAILIAGLAGLAATMAAAIAYSRSLAFDRLVQTGAGGELRGDVLPSVLELVGKYAPAGSGFGSFEYVYQIDEPFDLLSPAYLNNAHNDWVQVLVEGGVPAGLLLAAFVLWVVKLAVDSRSLLFRTGGGLVTLAVVSIGAIGLASLVDYPLRVPSLMAFFAIFVAILYEQRRGL